MPNLPKTLQLALLPLLASVSLHGATYTVKAGDTLSSIARRNDTTAAKLMTANGISDPKLLKVGQTLKIGGSANTATKPQTSSSPNSTSTHTVQSGETLYSISRTHGVSVSQLTALNPGLDPSKLSIGQKIKTTGSAPKPTPKPEPKPEVVKKPQPAPKPAPKPVVAEAKPTPERKPAPGVAQTAVPPKPASASASDEKKEEKLERPKPAPSSISSVMVNKEISFGALASRHQTSTQQLNDLNGWSLKPTTVLAKGSELYVPGL
jgi:LysM repeat protein